MFNELFKKATYLLFLSINKDTIKSCLKDFANVFCFTSIYILFGLNKTNLYMIYSKFAPLFIIASTVCLILSILFLYSRTINLNDEENINELKIDISVGIMLSFYIYFKIAYLGLVMILLSTFLH